jgi:DNA-binding YbaB/EbfC family protein
MKDIMGMMGKVKEMQEKMASLQTELEEAEVEGTAGGGLVIVRLSGKGAMKGVEIDASLLVPDEKEVLEDLLIAAHAMAREASERMTQEKTQELTAGLPIPPGFKMPF